MGIAAPITERLRAVTNYSTSYAWGPLVSVSRSVLLSLFRQISIGQLKIIDVDGTVTICGQEKLKAGLDGERSVYTIPQTVLQVHKETFWVRMLLFADMVCGLLPNA